MAKVVGVSTGDEGLKKTVDAPGGGASAEAKNFYNPADFSEQVITQYNGYKNSLGEDVADSFLDAQAKKLGVTPLDAAAIEALSAGSDEGGKKTTKKKPAGAAQQEEIENEKEVIENEEEGGKKTSTYIQNLKNKKTLGAAPQPRSFKDITEVQKLVEKNFGVKDINEFIDNATKWKGDSREKGELAKQLEDMKTGIASFPVALRQAIAAEIENPGTNSYLKVLGDPKMRVDYSKPFESNDFNALVEIYSPEDKGRDFSKSDDAEAQKIKNLIVKQFNIDQKSYEVDKDRAKGKRSEDIKKLAGSRDNSLSSLKKDIPDVSQSQLDGVRTILNSRDPLASLGIIGKDNVFTGNAAEVAWLAKYGKQRIKDLEDLVDELQGTQEEIITRSSDHSTQTGRADDVTGKRGKKSPQEMLLERMVPESGAAQRTAGGIKFTIKPAKP